MFAHVDNGKAGIAKGYRQVVFSPDGETCPVHSIKTSGRVGKRTTVQLAKEGDILLKVEWYPVRVSAMEWRYPVWVEIKTPEFVQELSPELKEFLTPVKKWTESYLPEGEGWDGVHTEANLRKEERIRALFKGLPESNLDNIVCLAMVSSFKGLLGWKHSTYFPECNLKGEANKSFVLWFEDGRVEEWSGEQTMTIPPMVIRLAVLYRDCYLRKSTGMMYGICWELYNM